MLKTSSSTVPTAAATSASQLNSGVWTITHHHHLHHHHNHHKHRKNEGEEDFSENDDNNSHHTHSPAHTHSHSHSHHAEGRADESDTDDSISEEDSIELQLEDFQIQDLDTDQYEVFELDIDDLGLGKEDFAHALSNEEVLEKLSRSLHDLPRLEDDPQDQTQGTTQGSKAKRKSRLSNVLVGLPRKIRIVRPKVVNNVLNVLEKNTLQPVPKIVTVLSFLSAINSICFCFADILLEILMVTGAAYHLTFRLSYLILVILSALIGVFTLIGIQKRELDMTMEALILGFVVETGTLVSDCYYVFKTEPAIFPTLNFRLAFIIGSVFNIFCVVVMFWKLHLASNIRKILQREFRKRTKKVIPAVQSAAKMIHHTKEHPPVVQPVTTPVPATTTTTATAPAPEKIGGLTEMEEIV